MLTLNNNDQNQNSSDSEVRREGREPKEKIGKEGERERHGNACDICFQKVIPPTLSASNPNVVSVTV